MPLVCRFVDSISATPTVRLNLNDGTTWNLRETSRFDPPRAQRSRVSTLMTDGAFYPATAYDDRVLELALQVNAATADAAATQLQSLARELDRASNILEYRLPDMTHSVFFRTQRLGLDALDVVTDGGFWEGSVNVPAEPFAYGIPVALNSVTVTNNPAAATNGMHFDVTGVLGDVETPLILRIDHADVVDTWRRMSVFAVRRRGTPSATPFALQAESMTQGTNTTVQANDATMSGASNNFSRTTFGTTTMTTRLSTSAHPSSASVDARGRYRVYLRYRKGTSGDVINVRLQWGNSNDPVTNDTQTLPSGTARRYVDLGDVQIPLGYDPVVDSTGVQRAALGVHLAVQAERASGSGNLDTDVLLLVPSDDRFAMVEWPGFSGPDYAWLDGVADAAYSTNSSGALYSQQQAVATGGLPMVSPGVTNRIFVVGDVNPASTNDVIGDTMTIVGSYLPRYLSVRGPST